MNVVIAQSGAFEVLKLVQDAGLEADCKLYTTLISTCAKSGKVDTMFKVWLHPFYYHVVHNIVNSMDLKGCLLVSVPLFWSNFHYVVIHGSVLMLHTPWHQLGLSSSFFHICNL